MSEDTHTQGRGSTQEGHAVTLAINTLAPYMLTALIERPARLICRMHPAYRNRPCTAFNNS